MSTTKLIYDDGERWVVREVAGIDFTTPEAFSSSLNRLDVTIVVNAEAFDRLTNELRRVRMALNLLTYRWPAWVPFAVLTLALLILTAVIGGM